MIVEQLLIGGDRNFAYIVADSETGDAAVIDPSYNPEMAYYFCEQEDLEICYVFNTHGHYDHTNGNREMESLSGVRAVRYGDTEDSTGIVIEDGATLPLGDFEIRIIHTPGHTPDSMCLLIEDAVFTGDTLFVGKVGGTDLGDGARQEYDSLHNKLMTLPGDTVVFPGHNYGVEPESTIAHERETNPFITCKSFEEFVDLKANWAEYKRAHGIQ